MSYDDNNPEHRKEVEEYLTRPANKPIAAEIEKFAPIDNSKTLKPIVSEKHLKDTLDKFEDTRDFNDKRGKRFINKTTTAVENPNNPRSVAFNPTTQLFTNEKRDIAFKSYDEADAWNKSIGAKTNSEPYPTQATPEQVGKLAERLERNAQMTGGKGPFTKIGDNLGKPKPIIKTKKPYKIEPVQINFSPMPPMPYEPIAPDPYALELERRVRENIRKTEDEKRLNNSSGLAGLIGGFKQ